MPLRFLTATTLAIALASCQTATPEGSSEDGIAQGEKDCPACDFSGQDLQGKDFSDANLNGANFQKAQLQGADFSQAKLDQVDFSGADLTGAILTGAALSCVSDCHMVVTG